MRFYFNYLVSTVDERAVKVRVASSESSWHHCPAQIGLEADKPRRIGPVPERATESLDRLLRLNLENH